MFKIESYISPLLMGYLDKYVKLRQEDFQLSLWGGDAIINNLDLRLDELEKIIQLPVMFQSGHIHELRLHVPWTKLGSEPVVITINTVECILKVRDTAYDGGSTSHTSEAAAKTSTQRYKKRNPETEALPPGYLQSIINRIINNVTFVINNLILKFVEDDIVLSVNVKSAECYSVDRDWNRAFVDLTQEDLALRKVLNFADLTVCLDKTNASGHIESYQEPLAYRCAVTCRLHMAYENITSKYPRATRFNFYCDVLNLTLTDTQLPMFMRLIELIIAMYYGALDIPTASGEQLGGSRTSKNSDDQSLIDVPYDDENMEENQGWASWAWSYVPQILPSEEGEEAGAGGMDGRGRRARHAPVIMSLGFYFHQGNIVFKLTEKSKESSELPHKKMHFHPFLNFAFEGASLDVLIQGLAFCNVQSGITSFKLVTCGNCICGVADDSVTRCQTLLSGGESLTQKNSVSYLSNSLFDSTSFENQGHIAQYILASEQHLQAYTEQYGLQKFGAFWVDYLYTFDKPKRGNGAGSQSSDTDVTQGAIFDKEFSTLRFLLGNSHVVFSSTFYHRVSKFLHCMWDHQYEPYGWTKSPSPSEDRPKPTEEQIMSLEDFIPTQLVHLALINPSAVILTAEHEECDIKNKCYKSRHRKRKSKQAESSHPSDLACVAIGASRFDLQVTKPMYPGRLVKLVSAIAGPSSNLLHHCHNHTQIKLFSLQVGLQRASCDGKMSRPFTLVPPCSFALYSRTLLLPKLWNNTSLPIKEWMYEIPSGSINLNKASVIMASRILSSWLSPKVKQMAGVLDDSLLDDLFPPSGESTSQRYPLLELNFCGLEFKSCNSCLVDAYAGSLSSLQVFLYTPGTGGRMVVIPILGSPSDTSRLSSPSFFSQSNLPNDSFNSDCITATLQKPKNTGIRQAQALALVDCQGFAVWLDPVLTSWFHYCPQPRPLLGQPTVTLDMSLAQMTSPLNAMSQASVHSTSSPSHAGRSQAQASSQTAKPGPDRKSQPMADDKDRKRDKAARDRAGDAEKETMAEALARYFPLIQALHLQMDLKSSVVFLPKAGLPTNIESTSDIVTTVQQAYRAGHLSSTLVICLPAIKVSSTMSRPMNVLQELPVTDFHESLIGEKLPWTIKLLNSCVYTLFPGQTEPVFLMRPVDVVSTLAINCTYNPPTSEQISGLAFCIHTDVGNPHTSLTGAQLHLLSIVFALASNLIEDSLKLFKECNRMFFRKKDSDATGGRGQSNQRISCSSATHKMDSIISGEVTEQLTTDISEDMSHDASPLHESLIDNEEENGIKLSLWLQIMVGKLECQVFHTCPRTHKDSAVSCLLETFDLSLDTQSVYCKVKMTLGSFSMQHAWKGPDGSWCWTDPEGIIVSCTRRLPRHIHTISNKLWLAENSAGVSFAQSHDTINREKKHGVLSVTLTHALCKNVKRRLRKANVELPVVDEQESVSSERGCDSDYLYFHEYLTEICFKVGPVDVVVKAEAVDVIMGLLSGIGKKSQMSRRPPKSKQSPVFVSVARPLKSETSPLASLAVHNLPLLYADVGLLRIFVPLPGCKNKVGSGDCIDESSSLSNHQSTPHSKPSIPSASAPVSQGGESLNVPIMSQPGSGANATQTKNTTASASGVTLAQGQMASVKDVPSDGKGGASTLDHDMLVIQMSSFVVQPHAENPLPRTPCDKPIFHKALQSGMTYQPGASVEDRQYQIDVRGLALSTGCWAHVMKETKKAEAQKSPSSSMVQIPALEWNTFLMDSVGEERKDIKLVPLATAFDTCLVVAPPIYCLPQLDRDALWKSTPHLICGLTMELNLTSDLDLYVSTSQLDLLNRLALRLSERFNYHPHATSVAIPAALHSNLTTKTHEGSAIPVQPINHLAVDPSLPSNRGGDSGVESDISTLTLDQGHRAGVDRSALDPGVRQNEERMNLSSLGTPFTGSPRVERGDGKANEASTLLSSQSFFDLLVTAGRISCTVYMHKILDEKLTMEMPMFQERKSHQRQRHQSSYETRPTGLPVKDNLDQRLKSTPRRRYSATEDQREGCHEENEESSGSNEEEFTEFNFMKQTSEDNVKKTIPEGSACILPFVYLYLTQPHCILSNHGGTQMKAEVSFYDFLIKGASDHHLSAIDDYHIIPDCADFNVHWLETRAGQPHPYTGIPPSLLTAQFLREPDKPDTIGLHFERPLRLKASQLAVEQIVAFSKELKGLSLAKTVARQQEKDNKETHPDTSGKAVWDPLTFVDRISLSTSQVVVAMEMSESEAGVGGTFNVEGFKTEIDLQRTESEVSPIISSHMKNVFITLAIDKKSRPLVGPVTLSLDACLSWIPIAPDKFKPQLLLVVDAGIVLVTLGQGHIFCMTRLVQTLTKLQQELFPKLPLPDRKHSTPSMHSEPSQPPPEHVVPDFIQDYSHDDLRRGGFKFVDEIEGSESIPEPNEIVFSSSSSSWSMSSNNNNMDLSDSAQAQDSKHPKRLSHSYMSWCYPHPRVITGLQLTPVPFSLSASTNSLDSSYVSLVTVPCLLQYYDELVEEFVDVVEFELSESEPVTVALPEAKPCNASQLAMAKLWRVILIHSDKTRGDAAVLPASLAACMCIDSAFIPSLIPDIQVSLSLPLAEIDLCHHLEFNGKEIPTKLSQYQSGFDLVEEQQFAVLKMTDIQLTGCHFSQLERKSNLKTSLSTSLDVMEYGHLSMMPVIAPVSLSLAADLINNVHGHELDAVVQMGKVRVMVGKSVIHSINMAVTAWTNFNGQATGQQLIFNHYVVCNNTMSTVRVGQVGTEENIVLHSRQMYAYSWRSFTSAQMLHLCINKPSWKWTEPFPVDEVGTWVRSVNAKDQNYVVIIKVTELTPVQKQITISGQMLVSNQLSQAISLKVCSIHPSSSPSSSSSSSPSPTATTPVSFDPSSNASQSSAGIASYGQIHHYVIQPGSTMPSLVASQIHNRPIQFRLAGFATAWSHEIYLSGDSMKDNQMVKIPLPDDNTYFHIWCRIFCQHFQGMDQKLVRNTTVTVRTIMLTPLYVIRTHLPRPFFIHLESSKVKDSQELFTKSRGHEFQFHCMGGDITHNMSFRLGSDKQLSRPPVVLSTGLIDQIERKSPEEINIDALCQQKRDVMLGDWPYLLDASTGADLECNDEAKASHLQRCSSNESDDTDTDTQPSIDLNVRLSEYIPGCETLLVDVTPPCLVTNATDLTLVLGETSSLGHIIPGSHWTLKGGQTISPPLPSNHFVLALELNGEMSAWKQIPISGEPSDYKRYNEDIGKVLFIDSHVQVSFSAKSSSSRSSEMVFLTVTSDFQHGIRTICIREQFCISNKFKEALEVKLLALPLSTPKISAYQTAAATFVLPSRKGGQGREVDPLPRWSMVDASPEAPETTSEGKAKADRYVFYISLAKTQQSGLATAESHWHWSQPVRVNLTKGSHRMTTSLPCQLLAHASQQSHKETDHPGCQEDQDSTHNIATTQALCLSSYQKKGVTYLVLMEDAAPVIVVENLCPFALEFGQALSTGSTKDSVVQEQLELVSDLPWVPPGGWSHYTMPTVNVDYSTKETLAIPRMLFRVKPGYGAYANTDAKESFEWSSAVQISGLDAFIRLQDICDLTVKIEAVGMVTHLIVRPVSKAEITAKEIRSRLKTQETESVRSVATSGHDTRKTAENVPSSGASKASTKSKAIQESLRRYTETKAGKDMMRSQSLFKATAGFYCGSITVIIQDESTPGEMAEIMSFFLQDLYVATFPLSHNPSFVGTETCYAISVGYAQLDNQHYGNGSYDFPVIFRPQTVGRDSGSRQALADACGRMSVMETLAVFRSRSVCHAQVVTFSDKLWSQSTIESAECSIQPFSLFIEDGFVYKLIEELERFAPSRLVTLSTPSCQLEVIQCRLPPGASFNARMLSQPVRIKQLIIQPVSMLLSVHASLKLFLASDQTPLNLAKFERMLVFSSTQRLLNAVTMHYASAAIFKAGIVVGSLEILGNPTGLVRSISTGVSDLVRLPYSGLTQGPVAFVGGVSRGVGSLVKNVSAGMITSVTNFASSISRNMDRLSLDATHKERQEQNRRNRPSGMSDGLIQGLTGFGLSLLGAVAGLADQPIRELLATSEQRSSSATSTASGLVAGMGKGIVGMFTKPIGGAAELVSQTGQGILHGTGLGHMPTRIQLPSSLEMAAMPSSRYKYCVKLLTSLPSPAILLSVPAMTFDMLGREVKVILVLTSDVLVVVNVEEDSLQLTLSLSELECHSVDSDDGGDDDAEDTDDIGGDKKGEEREGGAEVKENGEKGIKNEGDVDEEGDDDDDIGGMEVCGEMEGFHGKISLVWTDHYYTNSALEHTQNASKERIAAFIDSTHNLTAGLIPPETQVQGQGPIQGRQPVLPLVGTSFPDRPVEGGSPPLGQETPPFRRSVSDSSQTESTPNVTTSTNNTSTKPTDSPQYDFNLNPHWKHLFLTTFHTAKHRLQGRGFSL